MLFRSLKRIRKSGYDGRLSFNLTTYSDAYEYDGKPKYETPWYAGH